MSIFQSLAAQWISHLLDLCKDRSSSPNAKILKNLCSFACADPEHTPAVRPTSELSANQVAKKGAKTSKKSATNEKAGPNVAGSDSLWQWDIGIITLIRQQKEVYIRKHTVQVDMKGVCMCVCCVHTCVHVHVVMVFPAIVPPDTPGAWPSLCCC